MSKKINFKGRSKTDFDVQPRPYPAVKQLPKWFLEMDPYSDQSNPNMPTDGKLHFRGRSANATFKKCVPLLDGMSAGYLVPLWADVMVEQNNGLSELYWKTNIDVFSLHGESTRNIVPPFGYENKVFKYGPDRSS